MPPDSPNPSPTHEVETFTVPISWCKVCDVGKDLARIPSEPCGHDPETHRVTAGLEAIALKDYQAEVEKREEAQRNAETAWFQVDAMVEGVEAAESKLSSVVADKEEAQRLAIQRKRVIEEAEDAFEAKAEERGLHPMAHNAYVHALQLLRDKGTEQGGGDG